MFADNSRIQFKTSKEAIFLVNKELDVAIITLQRPAGHKHLLLDDEVGVDMGSPVHVMGYCQESGLINCFNDFKLSTTVEEGFVFYTAGMKSEVTGAPVM